MCSFDFLFAFWLGILVDLFEKWHSESTLKVTLKVQESTLS